VTGTAGFIGSTLAEALVGRGDHVVGIDCLTPYYSSVLKEGNLLRLRSEPTFEFIDTDLRTADLRALIDGADVVFHEAAQPGVRLSWANFAEYDSHNVLATYRLLEAVRHAAVGRLVFASSSSVYGNAPAYPTTEDDVPRPHSPYGVTKLAAEHLCRLYADNWDVPTVALRYFTVYGPRQRPDMAIHRLLEAGLSDQPFPLFGDGSAVRDFTYVADIVAANLAAASSDCEPGTVVNIAGGASTTVADLIAAAGDVLGEALPVERKPAQPGDVQRTGGSIERAQRLLGWEPRTDLREGLVAQLNWHLSLR